MNVVLLAADFIKLDFRTSIFTLRHVTGTRVCSVGLWLDAREGEAQHGRDVT